MTALRAGQAAAERQMVDTFTAYSPDGNTPVGGYETPAFTEEYSTRGKIQGSADTATQWKTVGGTERPLVMGGLHIPVSADPPGVDWEFECTAVAAPSDQSLLGRRWRVVNAPAKTNATARRLDVVEV